MLGEISQMQETGRRLQREVQEYKDVQEQYLETLVKFKASPGIGIGLWAALSRVSDD